MTQTPRWLILILNRKGAFKVSMSKAVLHQRNKSFNKSQNREVWILAELLQCNVLGVILPPMHLLRHTHRPNHVQTCANTCIHTYTNRMIGQNLQRREAELCGGT